MLKLFKNIFSDVWFLYKNFFHFNLSKILIILVTILYILVLLLPIFLLLLLTFYFLWIFNTGFSPYLFLANWYYLWFWIFFIVLSFFIYIIWYSWSTILLNRLSLWYINREKLSLSKNYYFDFKLFWTYFKLSFIVLLIIFSPILFWFIWSIILLIIFWWIQQSLAVVSSWMYNWLSISLLILTIISVILFLYLSYKTLFVYVILVDKYSKNKKLKKVKYYLKKSFQFTKWFKKFYKLVLVLLVLIIFTYPVYYFESYFSSEAKNIKTFINYDLFVKSWWDLKDKQLNYMNLKLEYWNKNITTLSNDIKFYSEISMLFYILEFLFVWWLYNMVIMSFYKFLKKEEK